MKTYTGIYLFFVGIVLALMGGWVANIVKLIGSDFVWNGMLIARAAGIFVPPLGGVLGYL